MWLREREEETLITFALVCLYTYECSNEREHDHVAYVCVFARAFNPCLNPNLCTHSKIYLLLAKSS